MTAPTPPVGPGESGSGSGPWLLTAGRSGVTRMNLRDHLIVSMVLRTNLRLGEPIGPNADDINRSRSREPFNVDSATGSTSPDYRFRDRAGTRVIRRKRGRTRLRLSSASAFE